MPSQSQSLSFAIRAVNEASATLKQVQSDIAATGQRAEAASKPVGGLGKMLGDVGKIAGGFVVAQGIMQLPGLFMGAAKAAAEDAASTDRLNKSLENLAMATDGSTEMLADMKAQVDDAIISGQALAFTDDQVRDSFQFLAAATGDMQEALTRQKAAFDLSRGANIDLGLATKMLGKLNEENIQVFKKMGIVLADNATEAEALGAVQAKFGGQAETYAKSSAGQMQIFSIKMAELKEQLGYAVLPLLDQIIQVTNSPAFTAGVKNLADALAAVPQAIGDTQNIFRKLQEGGKTLWKELGLGKGVVDSFGSAWQRMWTPGIPPDAPVRATTKAVTAQTAAMEDTYAATIAATQGWDDAVYAMEWLRDEASLNAGGWDKLGKQAETSGGKIATAAELARDAASNLDQQLGALSSAIDSLTGIPLTGMTEFDDKIFSANMHAKELELALLRAGGSGVEANKPLVQELEKVRDKIQELGLERDLTFEPMKRTIEQVAKPAQEISFQNAVDTAIQLRQQFMTLAGAAPAEIERFRAEAVQKVGEVAAKFGLIIEHQERIEKIAGESKLVSHWWDVYGAIKGAKEMLGEFYSYAVWMSGQGVPMPATPSWDVPHMAQGGIIRRPTLALLGESGPEAVVPLGSGGVGSTIVIQAGAFVGTPGDARKFARLMLDAIRGEQRLRVAEATL